MPDATPIGITLTPAGMVRGFFGQLLGADPVDMAQGVGRFARHPLDTTLEAVREKLAEPAQAYQALRAGRYGDALGAGTDLVRTFGGSTGADVADTVNMARAHADQVAKAYQMYRQGRNLEAGGHAAAAILPGAGPAAARIGERMSATGDLGRGIGETAALLNIGRAFPEAARALRGADVAGRGGTVDVGAIAPPPTTAEAGIPGSGTGLRPSLAALAGDVRIPPAMSAADDVGSMGEFQVLGTEAPPVPRAPSSVPDALETDRYTPEDLAKAKTSVDRLMKGNIRRK